MSKLIAITAALLAVVASDARQALAGPGGDAWLKRRLTQLAGEKALKGAKVGYLVARISDGRALAARRARTTVPVASNVKIVTSVAALALLGPDYRFKTVAYARGRQGHVVPGALLVKGFGDPSLIESDLWRLACSVHDAGVRRIRGGIVVDESYFDGAQLPPLFGTRRTDAYYRPAVSALSLNENVVAVRVRPGRRSGDAARVVTVPRSSYLKIDAKVLTVGPGRRSYVRVGTRKAGSRTLVRVRGRVRVTYRGRWFRKRVEDPALLLGHTLRDLLRRRGVRVDRRRVRRGKVPRKAKALAAHYSVPLGEIVRRMNKSSSNMAAEQLLKVLGAERGRRPGSSAGGLKVIGAFLGKLGLPRNKYTMRNGSGLYEASAFSPRQLVRVLRAAYRDFRYGADFIASLPIAGVDGTLSHRFIGSGAERYVRAKTGTLAAVVSLSGYAGAKKRDTPLAFSILVSELPRGRIRAVRRVVDRMAQAIVTYLER